MRPFPAFGNLDQFETTEGGRRQYNALIVKLDKRTASGFGGRFSYTFSSTQDNTFGQTSNFGLRTNGAQNNYDLDNEYSSAIPQLSASTHPGRRSSGSRAQARIVRWPTRCSAAGPCPASSSS